MQSVRSACNPSNQHATRPISMQSAAARVPAWKMRSCVSGVSSARRARPTAAQVVAAITSQPEWFGCGEGLDCEEDAARVGHKRVASSSSLEADGGELELSGQSRKRPASVSSCCDAFDDESPPTPRPRSTPEARGAAEAAGTRGAPPPLRAEPGARGSRLHARGRAGHPPEPSEGKLSLIHISEPRDATLSRMPSSA